MNVKTLHGICLNLNRKRLSLIIIIIIYLNKTKQYSIIYLSQVEVDMSHHLPFAV